MKGFFVSLVALFEKHGAAQTGILTNKNHYKETRSFEYLNFPAKLQAELFEWHQTTAPASKTFLGPVRESNPGTLAP